MFDSERDEAFDLPELENLPKLSEYSEYVVEFIAGFVAQRLRKSLKCVVCIGALIGNFDAKKASLIHLKSRGGLSYPSSDLLRVVKYCEKLFRSLDHFDKKNLLHYLSTNVLTNFLGTDLFENMHGHMFDSSELSNHYVLLLKCVSESYISVRLHYATKTSNKETIISQFLTKYIIFKHQ